MSLKTGLIVKHTNKHLLIHLVRGGGSYDAAKLLQASQQMAWGPVVAQHPQTVRQTFGKIQVIVCHLPEVKQLQDVLLGQTSGDYGPDILQLNFDPWQAVGDLQEVL